MQIVIRHFNDRKKPCLMLEQGNEGIVLATFRNTEMEKLYTLVLGGNNVIAISGDNRSIDEMLEGIEDADCN